MPFELETDMPAGDTVIQKLENILQFFYVAKRWYTQEQQWAGQGGTLYFYLA